MKHKDKIKYWASWLVGLAALVLMSTPYAGPNYGVSDGVHFFVQVDDSLFGVCVDISGYERGLSWK